MLDIVIVAMCSVTGVFCIALAPLAFLYRRWRGPERVPRSILAILTTGAVIQLLALFVLQYHLPSGFGIVPRPSVPPHATVSGFFQILGAKVIAGGLLGNSVTLSAAAAAILGLLGFVGAMMAFRRENAELRLMLGFGSALFAMALAHPAGIDWPTLMKIPASRYFIIPQLAAAAALVWAIGHNRRSSWHMAFAGILLYICVVTVPLNWRYHPFEENGFAQQAAQFEREPPGAHIEFPLEPGGWSMTLVKH
ncbi:MAG: hypothetical protein ACREFT_06060 [Acetobacteraceae bacterium]